VPVTLTVRSQISAPHTCLACQIGRGTRFCTYQSTVIEIRTGHLVVHSSPTELSISDVRHSGDLRIWGVKKCER
jgi:hypothetical protein